MLSQQNARQTFSTVVLRKSRRKSLTARVFSWINISPNRYPFHALPPPPRDSCVRVHDRENNERKTKIYRERFISNAHVLEEHRQTAGRFNCDPLSVYRSRDSRALKKSNKRHCWWTQTNRRRHFRVTLDVVSSRVYRYRELFPSDSKPIFLLFFFFVQCTHVYVLSVWVAGRSANKAGGKMRWTWPEAGKIKHVWTVRVA